MLVCHCRRVNDRTVRSAIQSGARNVADVGRACGAGTGCGGCQPAIDELLEHEAQPGGGLPMLRAPEEAV